MTMRLSNSSFTGMARTQVAVGSSSEAFMFFATAADGPRSVTYSVTRLGAAVGRGRRVPRLAAGAAWRGRLGGSRAGAGPAPRGPGAGAGAGGAGGAAGAAGRGGLPRGAGAAGRRGLAGSRRCGGGLRPGWSPARRR